MKGELDIWRGWEDWREGREGDMEGEKEVSGKQG